MDDVTRRRALLALVVVTLVVLAGIGFARGRDGDSSAGPHRAPAPHRVQVARDGVTAATLHVVGGTDSLTITDADLGGDLAGAQTPDGARVVPVVQTSGSTVTVGTRDARNPQGGPAALSIRLDRSVAWTIRTDGGSSQLRVHLQSAHLNALAVDAGVSTLDLDLLRPRGLTDVHVSGGASLVQVHLPTGTAARFTFSGGAGSATVGQDRRQGLAGGTVIAAPGWPSAQDRLDVHLDSGIGSLVCDV